MFRFWPWLYTDKSQNFPKVFIQYFRRIFEFPSWIIWCSNSEFRTIEVSCQHFFLDSADVVFITFSICILYGLNSACKHNASNDQAEASGYTDVGDGCWRRNVLATTLRCWWRFWPSSFNFSVRHGYPKDVKHIEIPSPTPENCHQHLSRPLLQTLTLWLCFGIGIHGPPGNL